MKKRKGREDQGKSKKVKGKKQEGRSEGRQSHGQTETIPKEGPDRLALRRRLAHVPPPDSDVWPPEYRGERWKRRYALLFAGKCLLCAYSFPQPESRRIRDQWLRQDTPLLCTNHATHPGEMIEVLKTETCRNFTWRCRRRAARKKAQTATNPPWPPRRKKGVRRVPLSQGLFATVDAADYPEIRKHKWSVLRVGTRVYAQTLIHGRHVLMHRFLLRPRKGHQVDHIDGNGLNNCRSNLRVCTLAQNQANRRPSGGSSRFVGVSRRGDRWRAWITYRGVQYWLGTYADEVEAAKARDRKAVELHGVYAYLNFPEDWTFDKNGVGHPVRATPRPRRR